MSVVSPESIIIEGVSRAVAGLKRELSESRKKFEKMYPSDEGFVVNKDITLYKKGRMLWWTKIKEASLYRLRLFIKDDEIDIKEIERNKAYYNFSDLHYDLNYKVKLEIENRDGKIINELSIDI